MALQTQFAYYRKEKKVSNFPLFSSIFSQTKQSQVSILGPVGYGPTTLPLRHSDLLIYLSIIIYLYHKFNEKCMIQLGLGL
ncbi:hypothetical protein ACB092_12G051700 [Castanea dentata]